MNNTIESQNGTHAGLNLKTATAAQLADELDRCDAIVTKTTKADRKAGAAMAEAIADKRNAAAARKAAEDQRDAVEKALNERQAS